MNPYEVMQAEIETLRGRVGEVTAERDRLAATVERVRAVMNNPDVVTVHMGGGNLVAQKKVIFPEYLRAAIEGTES